MSGDKCSGLNKEQVKVAVDAMWSGCIDLINVHLLNVPKSQRFLIAGRVANMIFASIYDPILIQVGKINNCSHINTDFQVHISGVSRVWCKDCKSEVKE